MSDTTHKIGIFGGTFDPIHIGHLILAQSAYEELKLEKIVFIPAGNPPHKHKNSLTASDISRIKMIELALENNSRFEIDTVEMESDKPSYSYITLEKLKKDNPQNDYYFIIGEDSLVDFHKWKNPERISAVCHVVVGIRPGSSRERIEKLINSAHNKFKGDFIYIKSPILEISSTDIRQRISEGKSARYYIPEKVLDYILCENIYNTKVKKAKSPM